MDINFNEPNPGNNNPGIPQNNNPTMPSPNQGNINPQIYDMPKTKGNSILKPILIGVGILVIMAAIVSTGYLYLSANNQLTSRTNELTTCMDNSNKLIQDKLVLEQANNNNTQCESDLRITKDELKTIKAELEITNLDCIDNINKLNQEITDLGNCNNTNQTS